jgi:predicted component of viral defense system (DUF524 family)
MANKFVFRNEKVGEVHLETSDVRLPDIIRDNLHTHICNPKFQTNGFKLISDNLDELQQPVFFDWQNIKVVFIPYDAKTNDKFSFLINKTEELTSGDYNGKPQIFGNVKIKNYVGNTTFQIIDKYNDVVFKLESEIFPQKLDYKEDFKKMITEITEILYSLIYDYLKKTFLIVAPTEQEHSTLTEWLAILQALFDSLENSLQLILRSPHSKIITTNRIRQIDRIRKVDGSISRWVVRNQKYLSTENTSGYQIQKGVYTSSLQENRKRITHNTFENRFIKWAINNIVLQMERARQEIKSLQLNEPDKERAESELLSFRKRLIRHLKNPVFYQVEGFQNQMDFSTVLTMAPGYKDFYFRFLLLRRGLSVSDNDIFKLDYKDIATLYEYWCFLKTIKILKEEPFSYNLESTDIIKLEHTRFTVDLKKGKKSEIIFTRNDPKETFVLAYNREFRTPTYSQIPDNFIEFRKSGEYKKPFRYLMDAKYRFTREDENYPTTRVKHGPPLDTIAQLHRYRDAILSKSSGQRNYSEAIKSLGGIILFPFPNDEDDFKDHKFYKSLNEVNIGAIPLKPGGENNLYKQFLIELLESSPEYLYEQTINYDKSDYYKVIDQMKSPVLIGLLPKDNIEKRTKFLLSKQIYFIKNAQKYLIPPKNIKYVAINISGTKAIDYYAKVISIDNLNSNGLKKLGTDWSHSSDDYICFFLDKLIKCNISFNQMNSMGRRYTNYYSLQKAMEKGLQDIIFLTNEKQIRMWKEIYSLDQNLSIKRSSKYDPTENWDQSVVEITFSFNGNDMRCIQSQEKSDIFLINEKQFEFGKNLYHFLNDSVT